MVSEELKDLRKRAKKLKVEFEKDATEAELTILVEAAEAAEKAQAEKAGEVVSTPISGEVASTPAPVDSKVEEHEPVEGAKEQVMLTFHNKQKVAYQVIQTVKGTFELRLHTTSQVLAVFKTLDDAKHHVENLSRF